MIDEPLDVQAPDVADPRPTEVRDHVGLDQQRVRRARRRRDPARRPSAVLHQPPLGIALERLATRRSRTGLALRLGPPRLGLGAVVALDPLAAELRDRDVAIAALVDAGDVGLDQAPLWRRARLARLSDGHGTAFAGRTPNCTPAGRSMADCSATVNEKQPAC